MQKLKLEPSKVAGKVKIPPSKSFAHRALLCAALSGGNVNIHSFSDSKDMKATENFLLALGLEAVPTVDKTVFIKKIGEISREPQTVDCIESGSTLRFVIPIAAALGMDCTFIGSGRLPERPIGVFTDLLPKHGVKCESLREGYGLPLHISGKLTAGDFEVPGNISSQFITGLMYALPLLDGDSRIIITTKLESESYLNITASVLEEFGIFAERTDYGYFIPGNQKYKAVDYTVEGDWSQAAFFLTMGAFSKEGVIVEGLNSESVQGDKNILDIYRKMGIDVKFTDGDLHIKNPNADKVHLGLKPVDFNASDIPDAVPAISAALALADGTSTISGAGRLRIKECDRLKAVFDKLTSVGGEVEEKPDGLIIHGVERLVGGEINGYNDHRIVMTGACLSLVAQGDILISDPMSINKSYPGFYHDFNKLGGKASVIDLG
jgi:3-phosphoshikimate 1-carboxyvinyltransferase